MMLFGSFLVPGSVCVVIMSVPGVVQGDNMVSRSNRGGPYSLLDARQVP